MRPSHLRRSTPPEERRRQDHQGAQPAGVPEAHPPVRHAGAERPRGVLRHGRFHQPRYLRDGRKLQAQVHERASPRARARSDRQAALARQDAPDGDVQHRQLVHSPPHEYAQRPVRSFSFPFLFRSSRAPSPTPCPHPSRPGTSRRSSSKSCAAGPARSSATCTGTCSKTSPCSIPSTASTRTASREQKSCLQLARTPPSPPARPRPSAATSRTCRSCATTRTSSCSRTRTPKPARARRPTNSVRCFSRRPRRAPGAAVASTSGTSSSTPA